MPTEYPRPTGPRRDGPRIGGWLEAINVRRALPARLPLVTPPPPRVPIFQPPRSRTPEQPPPALPGPFFTLVEDPRQVRLRIAVTCLVATVVGAAGCTILAGRDGTAPAYAQLAVADPVTLDAMPGPVPARSHTSTRARPAPANPAGANPASDNPAPDNPVPANPVPANPVPAASPSSRAPIPAAARAVHHTTAPPAARVVAGLRIGGTVHLEVQTGFRHHHPAGAAFVVRRSASSGCVAFEAAGRPGYFLRHRDFMIHLDPADGSPLFRLDSAFCPVPSGDGSFRLRSANYPDRFVVAYRARLYLAPVRPGRPTGCTVRPG